MRKVGIAVAATTLALFWGIVLGVGLPVLGVNVPWADAVQDQLATEDPRSEPEAGGAEEGVADQQRVAQSVDATLTAVAQSEQMPDEPTATLTASTTPTPTSTATSTATSTDIPEPSPTPSPSERPTQMPSARAVQSETNINLRRGPGTEYPVMDALSPEDDAEILARNEAGDWFLLNTEGTEAWAAAWLLLNTPETASIPVAADIPTPPPTSTPTPVVETQSGTSSDDFGDFPVQLNVTRRCGHFEYKVYDLRRVKSVWLFDNEYIAQGHFLLLFVEVKNVSSGTSYLGNFGPRLMVFGSGGEPRFLTGNSKASRYAGWMYQAGGFYEDINPGKVLGLVEAYPLPIAGETPLVFAPVVCAADEEKIPEILITLGWWSEVPQGHNTP